MSIDFSPEELKAFRAESAKGATDTQFELFISDCKARSLRPGVHLVFQLRRAKEYDEATGSYQYVKKPFWITTIAALRLIAQRTGEYLGQGPEEYVYLDDKGLPTITSEIPLPDPSNTQVPREPWVARAKVYRKGFTEPMIGMARFEAYAATQKLDNKLVLTETWRKRGSEQLFKCAEALALRKAFAEEMTGLMLAEELKELEDDKPAAVTPASVALPSAPSVPPVNQVPAVGTDTPRPAETGHGVTGGLPQPVETKPAIQSKEPAKTSAKEAVLAAVPDLKPASEIQSPKKRGRKPKTSPLTGRDIAAEGGITDADVAAAGTPSPETSPEEGKKEAEAFVDSIDPAPTKEELAGFIARTRALSAKGATMDDLKKYLLASGQKEDTKSLTVQNWTEALGKLETALKDGKLLEVVKNDPV